LFKKRHSKVDMSGHMKALGDNIASHNDFFKFIKSDLLLNEF
jgi:hypothetical protein